VAVHRSPPPEALASATAPQTPGTYARKPPRVPRRLYSIGIGRTHSGTPVLVLVQDLNIRIIHAATDELIRELVLNTTKRYQPTGRPSGPTR
jgi:hypothetical protein